MYCKFCCSEIYIKIDNQNNMQIILMIHVNTSIQSFLADLFRPERNILKERGSFYQSKQCL